MPSEHEDKNLTRKIIADTRENEETRVAILEGGKLAEVFIERMWDRQRAGEIYKARVDSVLPGISAAFVTIGDGRNAFLYLNKRDMYPLQLFLREILVNSQFDSSVMEDPEAARQLQGLADTLKYVIIVVSTIPLMSIYPFVQKYFVKGVMIGSVKG